MRHSAATALLVCLSAGLSSGASVVWPSLARAEIAAKSEACAAWPGEIDPLPRVDSADPISARWARERAEALAADARLVETMSLQEARRYWQHVLCLDPFSDAGRAGMFRTGPFRVSGPVDVEPSGPPSPAGSTRTADGRAELGTQELTDRLNPMTETGSGPSPTPPEAVAQFAARGGSASSTTQFTPKAAPAPTPAETARQAEATRAQASPYDAFPATAVVDPAGQANTPSLTSVDQELSEIETLVAEAHFHTALSVSKATRGLLVASPATDAVSLRRARLEVLAATAAVALGRDAEALVSMSDALRANPDLQLDTATTSPKVVAILDEARRSLLPRQPARIPPASATTSSADIGAVR